MKLLKFHYNKRANIYVAIFDEPIKPFCNFCGKEIEGAPYFCVDIERFFHKDCLIDDKSHWRRVGMNFKDKPVHKDYPVVIQIRPEKSLKCWLPTFFV